MSAEHVQHLLSRAYDGDLEADQRALLDRHLGACAACSAAYADLATALEAVRGLPPLRMPHRVRLPEGLPGPAPRRRPWSRGAGVDAAGEVGARRWAALPLRHPWVSGLLGAAATAALIAAVVVPTTLGNRTAMGGATAPLALPAGGAAGSSAHGGPQYSIGSAPCDACKAAAGCPAALSPGGGPLSTAIPAIYNNREVRDDGVTTAIVATSVSTYAPGQVVEIYARLVDDQTGGVTLPCAYLTPASASRSELGVAAPTSGVNSRAVPAAGGLEGQGILEVRVPAGAAAGEILNIAVEVPAAGGQPAHQVSVSISVG